MHDVERLPAYSLLCHKHMGFALGCFESFLRNCRDPIDLNIISDGSLTKDDEAALKDALPGVAVHDAEATGEMARDALRDYPACWRAYLDNPLMRKIVDVPLLADGRAFAIVDSDVLWVRPFRGLDRRAAESSCLTFMLECISTYSIRFSTRYIHPRVPLVDMVNSGLLFVPAGTVRFDAMETFLADPRHRQIPWYMEQTSWSMLARRSGSRYFDPKQVALTWWVVNRSPGSLPDLVGVHVVSPSRHLLPQIAEDWRRHAPEDDGPRELRTFPSHSHGIVGASLNRISHRIRLRRWTRQGLFRN